MPFVPSVFKSLALCPEYPVLAHERAVPVLSTDEFGSAAQQLVASVRDVATPPADSFDGSRRIPVSGGRKTT